MNNQLKQKNSEIIKFISETVSDYISKNTYDNPVVEHKPLSDLQKLINCSLPEESGGIERVFKLVEEYLKYCVKTGHPQFFNQLWSGFNVTGFIGEIVTALTNTSMYTYEVAPVATIIEMTIIKKLLSLIGFCENGWGTFVTGGSNGNLLAMLIARNRLLDHGEKLENLCVFYSEKAHYSLDTAAMVLGISKSNIIKIPANDRHEMDSDILCLKINETIEQNKKPFFVCATAGTTVAGNFDPIFDIANILKEHKYCWFHIDGAHGGSVLLSRTHKYLLAGANLANSLVWDGHKVMGAPLICSVFLLSDKKFLNFHENNTAANDYLFHSQEESDAVEQNLNLGTYSLQCGRRADCVKLWLMWNHYGTHGLESRLDRLVSLARYAESKINSSDKITLAIDSNYVNVCFYYNVINSSVNHDWIHEKIKKTLYENGTCMVNTAKINNKMCIRLVISNPEIMESDLDIFFKNLIETGERIISEHSKSFEPEITTFQNQSKLICEC